MHCLTRRNKLKLRNYRKPRKTDKGEVWSLSSRWRKNRLNGKNKQKLLPKRLKSKSDSNISKKDCSKKVSIHRLRQTMGQLLQINNQISHYIKNKVDI